MKKSISIHDVTFHDVVNILNQWERGELTQEEVLLFAEGLTGQRRPAYSKDNPCSILLTVLDSLATLHVQPILKSDIPALRQSLTLGESSPFEARKFIDAYWDNIDWDKRVEDLYKRYKNKRM